MTGYNSFFDQGAEISGTLIGLLFVAISLSPHDWQAAGTPFPFRVQQSRSAPWSMLLSYP